MDYINSRDSRRLSARDSMRAMERACLEHDVRISIRKTVSARSRLFLGAAFGVPFTFYFVFNWFAPGGVWNNHRAASGAYMNYMQTFMYRTKTTTEIYRPEIALKEQASSLGDYTRRIAKQRQEGTVPEGVHHPSSWL